VLAVELNDLGFFERQIVAFKYPDVHRVQLWCRTRASEDMYATDLAEVVFCDPGAELIGAQLFFTGDQVEIFRCNAVVEDAFLPADRAVALGDTIDEGFDFEANGAAVAASSVARHSRGP